LAGNRIVAGGGNGTGAVRHGESPPKSSPPSCAKSERGQARPTSFLFRNGNRVAELVWKGDGRTSNPRFRDPFLDTGWLVRGDGWPLSRYADSLKLRAHRPYRSIKAGWTRTAVARRNPEERSLGSERSRRLLPYSRKVETGLGGVALCRPFGWPWLNGPQSDSGADALRSGRSGSRAGWRPAQIQIPFTQCLPRKQIETFYQRRNGPSAHP